VAPLLALAAALATAFTLAGCSTARGGAQPGESASGARTIRAGCRQGQCSWLRIARIEATEARPEGELRRVIARRGTSLHPGGAIPDSASRARIRWEGAERTEYAFCSVQRPAVAFPDEGGSLLVHFLDLFDLAGYQQSSAVVYMAICHGSDRLPDPDRLRALGYRPGTRSEQLERQPVESLTRF